MPAKIVRSGSGNRPPQQQNQQKALAVNPNVRIGRPAPNPAARTAGMPGNIRIRKPDPTSMAQAGAQARAVVQQQQPGMGLGQPQQQAGVLRCINPGCATTVIPGIDAMTTKEGQGPYCKNCWAHTWIAHNMKNIPDGPPCNMGVRFATNEWRDIQGVINQRIMQFAPQQRFPTVAEMDQALSGFKFSQVCASCHTDIPYSLDSQDFKIAGVTSEWPRNQPLPWQQQVRR